MAESKYLVISRAGVLEAWRSKAGTDSFPLNVTDTYLTQFWDKLASIDPAYAEGTRECGTGGNTIPSVPSMAALKNTTVSSPTIYTIDVDETRSDASGNGYATNTVYIKFPDGSIVPMGGEKEPTR